MSSLEPINPYVEKIKDHPLVESDLEKSSRAIQGRYCIADLGCGNGHFLEEYLRQNPNFVGLGIERRYKRVFKTAQKIERIKTENSKVIQMEVEDFLEKTPPDFWSEIWIQFPDPWPKLRHEKHRMITAHTFQMIFRALKKSGRFCFRSDCRDYWEFLQMTNIRYEFFPIVRSQKGDLFSDHPSTLFQRKFAQISRPIYSLEFRK